MTKRVAPPVRAAVSYMPDAAFNRAVLPLLQAGEVDALEWSFDTVRRTEDLPGWMYSLLKEFSDAGRLYGHGVYFSLFSGGGAARMGAWLERLRDAQSHFTFQHLSEHFGFMTSGNAHQGAPLPVPLSEHTLALGQARMEALATVAGVPVGVENLALAFAREDVVEHSRFLEALVAPVDGFLLLDLHNVYCSAHNFGLDPRQLLEAYPLHLVREMHISGGSWEPSSHSPSVVRRDTHDDAVPEEVFSLLEWTLPRCPACEVVVLERLGNTFTTPEDEVGFAQDFRRMRSVIATSAKSQTSAPKARMTSPSGTTTIAEDDALARQQAVILQILKKSEDAATAHAALSTHPLLANTPWRTESWSLAMIETAILLGKKWGIEEAAA